MKKTGMLLLLLIVTASGSFAQVQLMKFLGDDKDLYSLGYGGFLKFSYPILPKADISLEGGANIFFEKGNSDYGVGAIPVKLGFRYFPLQSGTGLYIEPQAGYNFFGGNQNDEKFTGPVVAATAGYQFPVGGIQLDIGAIYEKYFNTGGYAIQFAGLRIARSFSLRKREAE